MVQAWYLRKQTRDHGVPRKYIDVQDLYKKTGVEYFKLNPDTCTTDGALEKIKADRGYQFEDELVCSEELPDFEEMKDSLMTEHLHGDEEARLFLGGMGYFDVRDPEDEWIRIKVTAGDMIVLPAGIYHRFTFGPQFYRAMAETSGIIVFALWYIALAINYAMDYYGKSGDECADDDSCYGPPSITVTPNKGSTLDIPQSPKGSKALFVRTIELANDIIDEVQKPPAEEPKPDPVPEPEPEPEPADENNDFMETDEGDE